MKIWKAMLGLFLCLALFAVFAQPMEAEAAGTLTVYLDPAAGADTADGLTEATAVKSYDTAYGKIKTAGGGTIVLLSDLNITTDMRLPSSASDIPVVLTSKTGGEGITGTTNIRFNAVTTLEDLTVTLKKAASNLSIYAEGKKLTIGQNVHCVGAEEDGETYYFSLAGGKRWAKCSSAELVVQSGTWRNIYTSVYGYNSGSTVAGVSGTAKLTMTGGKLTGFITPSYGSSAVTGSVEISLSNMQATSLYLAPTSSGTVTGDVNITLGEGTKITGSVFAGGLGTGSVTGSVNITLDGADTTGYDKIKKGGGSDYTGSVGAANLTLKSGTLGTVTSNFDTVTVDVPAEKTLVISGSAVTADTVKTEGIVAFTGAATLNALSITGTMNCGIAGEMTYNQNFVVAAPGSDVQFPAESGVTEEDGVWACRDLEKFQGLVVTHDEGVTVSLYQGFATDTKVEPYLVEGNLRYYPNLAGKYRMVASKTGYTKVSKNIYISPEEAVTRMDETVSLVKRNKAWDPEYVRRLTDEAIAQFPSDKSLWPTYAEIFTTPAFTEGRPEHKFTTQTEMETFIAEHDDANDKMYVYSMGTTPTTPAFDIPLVIFTETDLSGATTIEEAAALLKANGKPTVHYHAQIHGNEHAAGEAALATIHMLDGAWGEDVLDSLNIYVIPRLNPDGAYKDKRVIPTKNVDPNRDSVNLVTYEAQRRAYVYHLFEAEVVLDSHEYSLSLDETSRDHKDLMYSAPRAPYATSELVTQVDAMAEAIAASEKANGLSCGWYSGNVSSTGAATVNGYSFQNGSIYYLLESYGIYAGTYTYERRVMAHISAVDAVLHYIDENAEAVNKAVNDQWAKLIEDGKTYGDGSMIILDASSHTVEKYSSQGKRINLVTGELTDKLFTGSVGEVINREREAPTAYIVPADHEEIEYILWHTGLHGISHYEIPAGAAVMAQHVGGTTTEATITEEQKTVFANGAYVFGMDQKTARILAYLMEPDVDDVAEYDSTYAMAGIFQLKNGEYPVYRYIRDLNSEGRIDYDLVRGAPQGLTVDGENGVISGLDAAELYEYRLDGSDTYTAVPAGATRITGLAQGKYYVRFQASGGQAAGADAIVNMYTNVTVYLDQKNGSDDNDGYSENAPVKTIEKAYAQMGLRLEGAQGASGKVVFLSEYVNTAYALTFPKHDFPVTLTSKTGAEGLHYNVSGTANNRIVTLQGDTTLENMTITVTAAGSYNYFCAGGYKVTIGEGVVCLGDQTFNLVGGRYSAAVSSTDLTVMSGTWGNVYYASYASTHNGPVKFTMLGGTVKNNMSPTYNKAVTGDITLYLASADMPNVFGGNASKTDITGNVNITLGQGARFKSFYAGSRDAGNINGTVTVTVDGADLTGLHLYGKCKTSGTVTKSVLVYKSGTLGTYSDFDEFVDNSAVRGDMNGDGNVTDADALYLLRYTLFADRYPIDQSGDVNGDGNVTDADALYLLRFTLFPERYPLQ